MIVRLETLASQTPSLYDSARSLGVPFAVEATPADGYIDANGLRFHYLDWGAPEGPVALMFHGFAQTCHMWDFAALSLSDRYRVVALDQRGHGDTDWAPGGDYTLEAHQRDVAAVVAALSLKDFVLVGLSMGARNAAVYAAEHPEQVRALVAVDWAPETRRAGAENVRRFVEEPDEMDSFEDFVDRVRTYSHRRPVEQIRAGLVHNVKRLPNGKWTWKYDRALRSPVPGRPAEPGLTQRLWDHVEAVRCPVLIVRGAESDVVSPEAAAQMRERMRDARLVEVADAGHRVSGDNPAGFQAVLDAFLEGLG
jgi:pimeloyl-ACP methyl ester carboxylesterase